HRLAKIDVQILALFDFVLTTTIGEDRVHGNEFLARKNTKGEGPLTPIGRGKDDRLIASKTAV
ncbi:MAG: hypothetical protein ACK53L_15045, partial [Pirellulaceae bacterium]